MSNSNINGHVIYNYVIPKKVKNPNNGTGWGQVSGDSIRMDHPYIEQMINRSDGFAVGTEKYITISGHPELQPFYVLNATFDENPNSGYPQMSQTLMNLLKAQQPKVDALSYIKNTNDTSMVDVTKHDMANYNDGTHIQCQNRNDQYIMVGFNSASTPQNGISYSNQFIPPNTIKRASKGTSVNNPNDNAGTIFAEYYKVRTCTGDPNVGDAGPWIWNATTSNATELATYMAHITSLFTLNKNY